MTIAAPRRKLLLFFAVSYVLFWALIAVVGVLISSGVPEFVQDLLTTLIAWSPTVALLVLFKTLCPDTPLKAFLKSRLARRTGVRPFLYSFLLQLGCFVVAVGVYLLASEKTIASLGFLPLASLLPTVLLTVASGPLGEELGWRGYALHQLERDHSPLVGSIVLGSVWGIWHLPLWFVSGFSGGSLALYVIAFLAGIIATSIVITYFYRRTRNILVAVWIHFWFNFMLRFVEIDLLPLLVCVSIVYCAAAVLLVSFRWEEFRKPA